MDRILHDLSIPLAQGIELTGFAGVDGYRVSFTGDRREP